MNKDLKDIWVYRMLHINNISHILEFGITTKNSPNYNRNYVNIGDASLIESRNETERSIICINEIKRVKIGDFIPFYFGKRTPMLFTIQCGYNSVKKLSPESIIYLVCNLNDLYNSSINYIFTDGHAKSNISKLYDKSMTIKINEFIKWEDVTATNWNDGEDLDLKRKKQAELLVESDIPTELIKGIICFNKTSENQIQSYISKKIDHLNIKIKIDPNSYF